MAVVMPQTAEQAHAVARQHYRAMLHHAAAGEVYLTSDAAAKFANACALAQMYELRQIRIALLRLAGPGRAPAAGWLDADEDTHQLHPAAPDVPYDGFAVNGRRR